MDDWERTLRVTMPFVWSNLFEIKDMLSDMYEKIQELDIEIPIYKHESVKITSEAAEITSDLINGLNKLDILFNKLWKLEHPGDWSFYPMQNDHRRLE